MKQILILLLLALVAPALAAQDLHTLQDLQTRLERADSSEKALNDKLAYELYMGVLSRYPTNATALIKASLLADRLGNRLINDKENRNKWYRQAHKLAQKAVDLYPNSADAHFTISVSLGRVALMSSGRTLVDAVRKIKYHADRAIELEPNDFKAYHVLGRWYYEIANLGAFKRAAVRVFFGSLPEASFELSRDAYEKSRELNPGFNLTYLELAKVYDALDQRDKAIEYLKKMEKLPPTIEDDARIKEEGRNLLRNWTS